MSAEHPEHWQSKHFGKLRLIKKRIVSTQNMDNWKAEHMSKKYCAVCLSLFFFIFLLKQQDSVKRQNTEHFMASAIDIEYLFVLNAGEWVWGQQTAGK